MLHLPTKIFKFGVINNIEPQSIPDGSFANALNWITRGDKFELRRGSYVLGTEQNGSGKITGFHPTRRSDGTQVLYIKRGRKLLYFSTSLGDFVEVGTDLFPVAAENEYVTFADYTSLAGDQMWFGSKNSSLYKIMTANPGSYTDMYLSNKNFKFWIKIKQNRMFGWNRLQDTTGVYGSFIDSMIYTTVSAEAVGASGSQVYAGTLAFKGAGARRTCFGVVITEAGGEVFTDNYNGILTGSAGGTGTINYTTGAYSVTFNAVTAGAVTVDYQWEDSTNKGIADFTKSATRLAGEGFIFRQDDGAGPIQSIESYGDTEFCVHTRKTYALTLTRDDTAATNLIYREKVGVSHFLALKATDDGVYYIDDVDRDNPHFRLLTLDASSVEVVPIDVTLNFNFEEYRFDKCAMEEWGDYIVFTGRRKESSENDRMFFYHKTWKSIDITDYYANFIRAYNGALVCGDSVSDNAWMLMSGFDDQDILIDNYVETNISDLGLNRLKKTKKFKLEGEIQINQGYKVYASIDRGAYVQVGTISGNGNYVDRGQSIAVGANTIGSKEVGGGSATVQAFHYETEIKLSLDKYENIQFKFVATGIGYVSISLYEHRDVRLKSAKIPKKYRNS